MKSVKSVVVFLTVGLFLLGGCTVGQVPPALRASHVVFMLGGLALLLIAGFLAVLCLLGRNYRRGTWWTAFVGSISVFIGGIPLGMAVAYCKYGKVWVWDFTDNKTLIILAYWAVALALTWRTAARSSGGVSQGKTCPWLILIGTIGTIALYAVPH